MNTITSTTKQKVNNNSIVNNNFQNNILLATKVDSRIYNDFIELKNKRKIRKDSVLLRPIIRSGIATCNWLDERGLFTLNDYKLSKILNGLDDDEIGELIEIAKQRLGV